MKNELFLIDCMEYMAKIPDKSIDLSIVDPPYGIFDKKSSHMDWKKEGSGGTWASKYKGRVKEWDIAPDETYFKELKRTSKNQIIWGANHFGIISDNYCVWEKLTISESFSMGMCEFAHISLKGNPKIFKHRPQDPDRFHPTQKPVALYKWLLQNYAKPGDKLFDSHSGSGSFRIAAHDLGFNLVSCELDPDYYRDNEARFQNHIQQNELFSPDEIQKSVFLQKEFL